MLPKLYSFVLDPNEMNSKSDIIDCSNLNNPDLNETSKDTYSYQLGYKYGVCMGRDRGSELGRESAQILIDEGSKDSPEVALNRLTSDDREKFNQLVEENIRRDYARFNTDDKIVVRRNYEIPERTARAFIDGYRNNFEKSYRDSFSDVYQVRMSVDASEIGSRDGLEVAKRVADSEARRSGVIHDEASRLGRLSAREAVSEAVRTLAIDEDGEVKIKSVNEFIKIHQDDWDPSTLFDALIEEVPDVQYRRNMEENLEISLTSFMREYPNCDDICINQYRESFRDTYMDAIREELWKALEREYHRKFERTFRESYRSTLRSLENQIYI